jgi:hypothetical protein
MIGGLTTLSVNGDRPSCAMSYFGLCFPVGAEGSLGQNMTWSNRP